MPLTYKDIYNGMTEPEKEVLHAMVGQVLEFGKVDFDELGDAARAVYRGFAEEQRRVVDAILVEAAKWCLNNGAERFEVCLYSNMDLLVNTTRGTKILATHDEDDICWVKKGED